MGDEFGVGQTSEEVDTEGVFVSFGVFSVDEFDVFLENLESVGEFFGGIVMIVFNHPFVELLVDRFDVAALEAFGSVEEESESGQKEGYYEQGKQSFHLTIFRIRY